MEICANCGKRLGACSGCAGDYEDSDRSVWEPDLEENDADGGGTENSTTGERDRHVEEEHPEEE